MAGRYSNDFIQKCGGMYIKDLKGSPAVDVRNFFCLLTLLATKWLNQVCYDQDYASPSLRQRCARFT
jgi:hypothetical protein